MSWALDRHLVGGRSLFLTLGTSTQGSAGRILTNGCRVQAPAVPRDLLETGSGVIPLRAVGFRGCRSDDCLGGV